MADNLDDGEFWLPPQFLTDDDDETSFDINTKDDDVFDAVSRTLLPYLSSSSETESDEEDHLAELTRRVAHSLNTEKDKPKGVFGAGSGSPQSTLTAFGSSGKGSSPNGAVSKADSQSDTWDLLLAAAGEVERMRLSEDRYRCGYGYGFGDNGGYLRNPPKPSPVSAGLSFYCHQQQQQQPSLSQQQLQNAQFQMLRQQQMAKQQQRQMVPNKGRNNNNSSNNNVRGGGIMGLSASAWPPLQHASGMRTVFLGNPSGKRESAGTGVFLPRCVETRGESRKKPVCSTALVPDRVAHALNLNLNLEGVVGGHLQHQQQPRFNGANGSAVPRVRSNNNNCYYGFSSQKRNNLKPQAQVVNHEIQLPQEWTY